MKRMFSSRTAREWVKILDAVPNRILRIKLARIVYWDHYGERRYVDRESAFDKYVWNCDWEVPREKIIEGLVLIGYSQEQASRRVGQCQ